MSDRINEVTRKCADLVAQTAGDVMETFLSKRVYKHCESEIEKLMAAALIVEPMNIGDEVIASNAFWNCISTGEWRYTLDKLRESSILKFGAYVFVQQHILVYRADFVVVALPERGGEPIPVVVECDGHDFHEKTKAQAERDRKRDRAMTAEGYRVFRFTGSEIWRDPFACAAEVMAFLSSELEKQGKANGQ